MAYNDLREWVAALERAGELKLRRLGGVSDPATRESGSPLPKS